MGTVVYMNTAAAAATKVHFMGTAFARSTACGKFVEGTRKGDPKWVSVDAEVTCERCRAARQGR